MLKQLLALGKLMLRPPLVAAIPGRVIIGARGAVWKITPEEAEKMADDLVDMAELARALKDR